jgi:hypothetical protein
MPGAPFLQLMTSKMYTGSTQGLQLCSCRPPSMPSGPVRKPAGSRVVLENTAGKLDIDIPPQGLGSSNIGTGLFALAWNAFVAFWTVGSWNIPEPCRA